MPFCATSDLCCKIRSQSREMKKRRFLLQNAHLLYGMILSIDLTVIVLFCTATVENANGIVKVGKCTIIVLSCRANGIDFIVTSTSKNYKVLFRLHSLSLRYCKAYLVV